MQELLHKSISNENKIFLISFSFWGVAQHQIFIQLCHKLVNAGLANSQNMLAHDQT